MGVSSLRLAAHSGRHLAVYPAVGHRRGDRPLGEVDWLLIREKAWFDLPGLFPYGGPGFGWRISLAATLVILAGYLGSIVESLGDYAATCAVAGEPYRVRHMNRGIFAEGLGSCLATVVGGLPCTSYTQA